MRKKLSLVLFVVDFDEQLDNEDGLLMDDTVDHLEDRVSELDHCFGNELDDHLQAREQVLRKIEVVLLKQVH